MRFDPVMMEFPGGTVRSVMIERDMIDVTTMSDAVTRYVSGIARCRIELDVDPSRVEDILTRLRCKAPDVVEAAAITHVRQITLED